MIGTGLSASSAIITLSNRAEALNPVPSVYRLGIGSGGERPLARVPVLRSNKNCTRTGCFRTRLLGQTQLTHWFGLEAIKLILTDLARPQDAKQVEEQGE